MTRILFIEPDRILGANAKAVMKRAGHSVDWHVDPQAAIDSADSVCPDVIVLDVLLAGRSGVEFLHEFHSYPEWVSVPTIVYSSISAEELNSTNIDFDQLNITAYHYKSAVSITELCRFIDKTLRLAAS